MAQDGFVKLRDDPLGCNFHISSIPIMRRIQQLLFYDNGERRTGCLLHESDNFSMIGSMTELLAAVTGSVILERLEDPLHLQRYFFKSISAVYSNPIQRLFPRHLCYPSSRLPSAGYLQIELPLSGRQIEEARQHGCGNVSDILGAHAVASGEGCMTRLPRQIRASRASSLAPARCMRPKGLNAAAMAMSSVSMVSSSLRLRRFRRKI